MTASAEMLAAVLGLVVGLLIGGLGGGGGVLAVPALVYLLGMTAQDATATGVVVVGITAAVGVLVRVRGDSIRWRTGLGFGAVGIPAAAAGAVLNQLVAEPVLLLVFATLMVIAAVTLLLNERPRPDVPARDVPARDVPARDVPAPAGGAVAVVAPPRSAVGTVVVGGACVGFLTGFLGVGGGFLVVPVLVIALRMPVVQAIGTSLLIIAINSVAAFATRVGVVELDWALLVPFTVAAALGGIVGTRVADRVSGAALGRGFAVLLLVVGAFVAIESIVALTG